MTSPHEPSSPDAAADRKDRLSRKSLMKGAIWAVPVMATTIAAPAFAASPVCPDLPSPTTWTQVRTNLNPATGTKGATETLDPPGFSQHGNAPEAAEGTYRVSTTLDMVAGRTYSFPFGILAGYGNNNAAQSTVQTVDIRIGDRTVLSAATRTGVSGYSDVLSIGAMNSHTLTYTATTTGPVTFEILFRVVPRGDRPASDDIVVQFRSPVLCS